MNLKKMKHEANEDKKKRKSCYKVFCENLYLLLFFIFFRTMFYCAGTDIIQVFNAAFLIVTIAHICLYCNIYNILT